MSSVISIVNQKGGVGKTTTAINLSTIIADLGYKVLLVDLDSQANTTSGIGINQEKVKKSIYDLLINNVCFEEVVSPTVFNNLHLLPACSNLAALDIQLASVKNREFVLLNILKQVFSYYDYIFIDCPPSLNISTVNSLVASSEVLIPVQCEYYALEGIAKLVKTIDLVKQQLNKSLRILGVVLTMYDKRTMLNKAVVKEVKKHFSRMVFNTIIPRNVRLAEAPSHGLPISLYNPNSKGAMSYFELSKEVLQRYE